MTLRNIKCTLPDAIFRFIRLFSFQGGLVLLNITEDICLVFVSDRGWICELIIPISISGFKLLSCQFRVFF